MGGHQAQQTQCSTSSLCSSFMSRGGKKEEKIFSMSLAISFKGCCLNYFPLDNPSSQGLRIVPTMQNKIYNCRYLGLIYPYIVCLARFACTCNHFWHNNFLNLHYFHSGWLLSRVSHFQTNSPIQGKHSSSPTQASRFYH